MIDETKVYCDICEREITNENYTIENVYTPETGTKRYHYCLPCFHKNAITCDVCLDSFVHYREHIKQVA